MKVEVQHTNADQQEERDGHVLPGIGLPKALFFAAAFMSFAMSVYLFFTADREQGIFVGLWVPSILAAGALLLGRNGDE